MKLRRKPKASSGVVITFAGLEASQADLDKITAEIRRTINADRRRNGRPVL